MYFFQAPRVRFAFAQRIDEQLADELRAAGVEVTLIDEMRAAAADAEPADPTRTTDDQVVRPRMAVPELNDFEAVRRVATLNLDVTTMLAYISAMTNGSADWEFPEAVLTEQALWERQSPVKAVLDSVFEGECTDGQLGGRRVWLFEDWLNYAKICCILLTIIQWVSGRRIFEQGII